VTPPRRIVFDTSTLVGAVIRASSIPERAVAIALETATICASEATLAELESILARDRFDLYIGKSDRLEFVAMLRGNAWIFHTSTENLAAVEPSCRDPKDDMFLALAAVSEADAIVTSDEDLLVLHPWRGIPIVKPAEFVSWYDLA
jgi:hypothetical protein